MSIIIHGSVSPCLHASAIVPSKVHAHGTRRVYHRIGTDVMKWDMEPVRHSRYILRPPGTSYLVYRTWYPISLFYDTLFSHSLSLFSPPNLS